MDGRVRVETGSRLHFGLLTHGQDGGRQFGGLGLMIERPGIQLTLQRARQWEAQGELSTRAITLARHLAVRLECERSQGPIGPYRVVVHHAPAQHVGLGTGTQLSLAVARAIARIEGLPAPSTAILAQWTDRGLRSGVGLHGHVHGGLIVDGGRGPTEAPPPLIARLAFPENWRVLVVYPRGVAGLHGPDERQAFAHLAEPAGLPEALCRIVLLDLLPAVAECDLPHFTAAIDELQTRLTERYGAVQGGRGFADEQCGAIAAWLRARGLSGTGQSSWGPALYAFTDNDPAFRTRLLGELLSSREAEGVTAFWTPARGKGADVAVEGIGDD